MSLVSRWIDKKLEAYQRELVDTHYKEVENMYRQMRGWRHDYRNHIQVLKAFAAGGDMDAVRKYLDELDTDLNTVDTVVKTGNAMADAILNSKISLAKSRGITVQADAHIPVKLKMSELDLIAEAEIYEKLNDMVGDKTAIYISHRLSSCKFCDEIVVFDAGRLVQQGAHEALLADESGEYAQLWNAQAQYYR